MHGHTYSSCPDRFSKGKGKIGHSKGSYGSGKKGKFKGKGMGKPTHFYDISALFVPGEIYLTGMVNDTCVVIDTGASENAVGVDSLNRLVQQGGFQYLVDLEDRPVFRFGNGQQSRAVSRVDLTSTALGTLSFYVLDGEASNTPPSLGGRSLRSIGAIMAYDQNLFIYNDKASGSQWMAVKMQPLPSAHVSVDLKGDLTAMDGKWEDVFHASTTVVHLTC